MAHQNLQVSTRSRLVVVALVLGTLLGAGLVPAPRVGGDDGALVAVPARIAFAGEDMCDGDPIFTIGKQRLNVIVRLPAWAATKYVSAARPVVVTINAPAGVTSSQIGYTGAFAEQGVIQYTASYNTSAATYHIPVRVVAPDPNGTGTYPVYVTAVSSVQTVNWAGASGRSVTSTIAVPR